MQGLVWVCQWALNNGNCKYVNDGYVSLEDCFGWPNATLKATMLDRHRLQICGDLPAWPSGLCETPRSLRPTRPGHDHSDKKIWVCVVFGSVQGQQLRHSTNV